MEKAPGDSVEQTDGKNERGETAHQKVTRQRQEQRVEQDQQASGELAKRGYRRAKNDRVWDWLREVYSNTHRATTAPAVILPFLRDERLQEGAIAAGDGPKLAELVRALTRDAQSFHQRLEGLYQRHSQRRGSSVDSDDLMVNLGLSQQYLAFVDEYQRVVLPTIEEIIEIFERAGLDTKTIRLAADANIVYQLFSEQSSEATTAIN